MPQSGPITPLPPLPGLETPPLGTPPGGAPSPGASGYAACMKRVTEARDAAVAVCRKNHAETPESLALCVAAVDGAFIAARNACRRQFGLTPEEAVGSADDPCTQCGVGNIPACIDCIRYYLGTGLKTAGVYVLLGLALAIGLYALTSGTVAREAGRLAGSVLKRK